MKDSIDIKIYYADTDCGGVVYYGNYLTYLERARTDFFEGRGIKLSDLMKEGIYFVVVHVDIKYHMPAKYADIITVYSEIEKITPVSVTFLHKVLRKNTDDILSTSTARLAFVDTDMKPRKMSSAIIDALLIKL